MHLWIADRAFPYFFSVVNLVLFQIKLIGNFSLKDRLGLEYLSNGDLNCSAILAIEGRELRIDLTKLKLTGWCRC